MSKALSPEQQQFRETIKATFNTIADRYDNPSQRYFPYTADYLINLVQPKPGNRVLDLATGTGLVAIAAAQSARPGGHVQAIDIAEGMLNKAIYNVNKYGLENVDFHEMDAENLEFKSDYFDLLTCSFGVFFFTDPDTAIKNWLRVLKPRGKLIITTFAKSAFKPLTDLFRKNFEELGVSYPETNWQRFADPEQCISFLEEAGYVDVEVTSKQMGHYLSNEQDWWEIIWNSGMRALVDMLTPEQLAQFRLKHLEEVAALKTETGIWLDVEVIFSLGRKPA